MTGSKGQGGGGGNKGGQGSNQGNKAQGGQGGKKPQDKPANPPEAQNKPKPQGEGPPKNAAGNKTANTENPKPTSSPPAQNPPQSVNVESTNESSANSEAPNSSSSNQKAKQPARSQPQQSQTPPPAQQQQQSQPQPQPQPQQQKQNSQPPSTTPAASASSSSSSPPPAKTQIEPQVQSPTSQSAVSPAAGMSTAASDDNLDSLASSESIMPQLVTHPLEKQWTFWTNSQTEKNFDNYDEKIKPFGEVTTVEDFWGCFNNMSPPTKLGPGMNLQLFKKGIKPLWEDPQNLDGSELRFSFPMKESGHLDASWQKLLLSLIGQTLEIGDEICGASLVRKGKFDRIEVWLRICKSKSTGESSLVETIKAQLVSLFLPWKGQEPEYKDHKETVQHEYSNAHRKNK